jgi:hypothetical protein
MLSDRWRDRDLIRFHRTFGICREDFYTGLWRPDRTVLCDRTVLADEAVGRAFIVRRGNGHRHWGGDLVSCSSRSLSASGALSEDHRLRSAGGLPTRWTGQGGRGGKFRPYRDPGTRPCTASGADQAPRGTWTPRKSGKDSALRRGEVARRRGCSGRTHPAAARTLSCWQRPSRQRWSQCRGGMQLALVAQIRPRRLVGAS